MIPSLGEISAAVFGLASAISWGAGDFSGGVASKRTNVFTVVIISQMIGAAFMLTMAFLFKEPLTMTGDLIYGAAAGIAGAVGLLFFYHGLAVNRMGEVAPISAIVTAALPVIVSSLIEGLPSLSQFTGFVSAFIAVWLISASGNGFHFDLTHLRIPVISGIGFSFFFILMDQVSAGAVFWPLVAARAASLSFLILTAMLRQQGGRPERSQLGLIAIAGILDVGGNVFYTLAAQAGRLDIAAVLASLFPAVTVLLARYVLREFLTKPQWLGLIFALIAVTLITL